MRRFARALAAMLRVNIANMLQYRGEVFLWSVWGIVNSTVLYVMWTAAAAGAEGGEIAGLNKNGFATYYFSLMIVGHCTGAWDVYTMSYLIRKGALSPQLLRPILPMWDSLCNNLAYKITTLMFVIPAWAIFFAIVRPEFSTQGWQFALGLLATLLGAAMNYVLCYTVSLVAFWATKLDAVGEIYFGLCMLLGGRIAPIDALPPFVFEVAAALPFRWMFAFPAELLTGMCASTEQALRGFLMQGIWLGLTVLAFRALWRVAIRRYSAVSG